MSTMAGRVTLAEAVGLQAPVADAVERFAAATKGAYIIGRGADLAFIKRHSW